MKKNLDADMKRMGHRALQVLIAVALILIILELLRNHAGGSPPFFYACFGVLGVIVIVIAGQMLKAVLMRGENYYDDK